MDILNRVEETIVPLGTFDGDPRSKGKTKGQVSTGTIVKVGGVTAIMKSIHTDEDEDRTCYVLSDPCEPIAKKVADWSKCPRLLTRSLDLEVAFWEPPSDLDTTAALPIAHRYTSDPSRGTAVRTLTYCTDKLYWPPQLREGVVSAPTGGRQILRAELKTFGGGSGALVWSEDGLIGTVQGGTRFRQGWTGAHPQDGERDVVMHSCLTRVRDLGPQIKALKAVGRTK